MLFWFASVFAALVPVILSTESLPDLRDSDHLRELLLVVIPVAALGITSTVDLLCTCFMKIDYDTVFYSIASSSLFVSGAVLALIGAYQLPDATSIEGLQFIAFISVVILTTTSGLVNEYKVASLRHLLDGCKADYCRLSSQDIDTLPPEPHGDQLCTPN